MAFSLHKAITASSARLEAQHAIQRRLTSILENFERQLKTRANDRASLRKRASRISCTCHVR
jgi:hypothetical protein